MLRPVAFTMLAVAAMLGRPDTLAAQTAAVPVSSSVELAAWLDARFQERWEKEGLTPAPVVDDATFLRRVYLDLVGTIPSVAQTRDFLADNSTHKRENLVDELLADRRYAEHLSHVWRRVLVPGNSPAAAMGMQMEPWLQQQFAANVKYDEFARRLVTTKGNGADGAPPLAFYQAQGNTPDGVASSVSQIFLGVRIGCAKCHNHPFAAWKKEDFWGMAAFFAGINGGNPQQPNATIVETKLAKIKPENSNVEYSARFLWGDPPQIPPDKFPREVLAQWLTSPQNPNFSATAVNRVWQQLCGRGMVSHVDDLDLVPAAERSLVLDDLGRRFAEGGFDLRWLVQGICKSRVYQRASETPSESEKDEKTDAAQLPTHRPLKTLAPEQVFDALEQALSLPVAKADDSPRHNGQRLQLIARLNEAFGDSAPDQYRAGIPQTLLMMNGTLVSRATDLDESRTLRAVVEAPFLKTDERIVTLYLAALTRPPRPNELETLRDLVKSRASEDERRKAYAEIFWALLNSPEFVLSR